MNGEITSRQLNQYFRVKLTQRERMADANIGDAPNYPMLVAYLGDSAMKAHEEIAYSISQRWPQHFTEISFLGINKDGSYVRFADNQGHIDRQPISVDETTKMICTMFGTRTHFQNKNCVAVYYVLDTSDFSDIQEYESWLPVINGFREALNVSVRQMLMILLNENLDPKCQDLANKIKHGLSSFIDNNSSDLNVDSILLLSNRRSDNAILEDMSVCYRIMTAVMALSNNNSVYTGFLFERNVFTAGYALVEKPVEDISSVVIRKLVQSIDMHDMDGKIVINKELAERLGISQYGTLVEFDNYADSIELPDPSIFPRFTNEPIDVGAMTAGEYNELTMGTWDLYFTQICNNVRNALVNNQSARAHCKNKFKSTLARGFSTGELIELSGHISEIRSLIAPKQPSKANDIMTAARRGLGYQLSTDAELVQTYLDAIEELSEDARKFINAWGDLKESQRREFSVQDETIRTYYGNKVLDVIANYKTEFESKTRSMSNIGDLRAELYKMLDMIFNQYKEIFTAPFEDELEERMRETGKGIDAKAYIRDKLTGGNVKNYIKVAYAHNSPSLSALILNDNTSLKEYLARFLSDVNDHMGGSGDKYYYYSNGSNSSAETLKIYSIDKTNLII